GTPAAGPQGSVAAPSATAPPATAPQATAPPAAAGPVAAVPAGWETHTAPPGWVAAVPASYDVRSFGGFPEYRDPRTGRTLRIQTGPGQPDAVADRQRQARSFAAAHPTYREVALGPATYRGYEAADWEFTYEGLHVLDRVFVVDGRGYSLYFQTPQDDFTAARAELETVFATFVPAPA
ncbi:MAG: serine/threonine protein kinase, partial [Frankiales bacterium]|nr:serine/threonine protein kinase [Frankiales bacterium]